MHEKIIMKYYYFLFISLLLLGCSSNIAIIKNTKIEQETNLRKLDPDELDLAIHLNRSTVGNVFNSAEVVVINGYKILYHTGDDDIYIIKNDVVIAGVLSGGKGVTVYKNTPEAPSVGSEKIIYMTNFLHYSGNKYTFEDFGLDGVDVIYENNDSRSAQSFVSGKNCRTLVARVACCQDARGQFLDGYRFTDQNGWKPLSAETLLKNCRELNRKAQAKPE
jgi:hypothetical protein